MESSPPLAPPPPPAHNMHDSSAAQQCDTASFKLLCLGTNHTHTRTQYSAYSSHAPACAPLHTGAAQHMHNSPTQCVLPLMLQMPSHAPSLRHLPHRANLAQLCMVVQQPPHYADSCPWPPRELAWVYISHTSASSVRQLKQLLGKRTGAAAAGAAQTAAQPAMLPLKQEMF